MCPINSFDDINDQIHKEESIIHDISRAGSTIFDDKEQAKDKEQMFEMMLDVGVRDKRESSGIQSDPRDMEEN